MQHETCRTCGCAASFQGTSTLCEPCACTQGVLRHHITALTRVPPQRASHRQASRRQGRAHRPPCGNRAQTPAEPPPRSPFRLRRMTKKSKKSKSKRMSLKNKYKIRKKVQCGTAAPLFLPTCAPVPIRPPPPAPHNPPPPPQPGNPPPGAGAPPQEAEGGAEDGQAQGQGPGAALPVAFQGGFGPRVCVGAAAHPHAREGEA